MFRPPYLARVAAGAAVYALEETRRLPGAALHLPITAISQLLQTSMHLQQFVTSLALKGDEVFERLGSRPEEQPAWATFDEDLDDEQPFGSSGFGAGFTARGAEFDGRLSPFDLYGATTEAPVAPDSVAPGTDNGYVTSHGATSVTGESGTAGFPTPKAPDMPAPATSTADIPAPVDAADPEAGRPEQGVVEPEVAGRYDYANMTLAQLRARLRMLSVEELAALLDYEQRTLDRAPFVTMLTNRIATVQAK
ncbi:lipid droplet-associated protein [Nocardia vermiculata]|uniref:Lipid droplet-associated protein n=1 Tax=Nocardia vermiculata TaxID=257274 RepID=A0A846XV32_9NOCA|nr:lipid droplet-associated protein [Nocardia vermiculata]NKY48958.1 lipid droplet-associated protein [Nocardia vermiculata]